MSKKRTEAPQSPMERLQQKYRDAVASTGEDMHRPSDTYLARWLQTRPADERREPNDIDLNQLYWLEQAEAWLGNPHHSTPTNETISALQGRWSADLEKAWPTPEFIPAAQELIHRMAAGDSIDEIIRSDESLNASGVDVVDYAIQVLVTVNRRYYQTRLWAWERLRLVHHPRLGGGTTPDGPLWSVREGDDPPPWLLVALGHYEDLPLDDDTTTQQLASTVSSLHPTIHAYGPVLTGIEGIWRWAEGTPNVIRGKRRPPHVITSNGGMVSVGGDAATVMDEAQEAAAFAAGLKLSDDTAVAFVLGLARWCDRGNRHERRSYVVVTVDDYCRARGWKKHHNGGFKPEHKAKARMEMMALNRVWVRHQVPDHLVTSDGTRSVNGPLMTVSEGFRDKSGQHITAFRMSPGTWADDYLEDNPNCTALVLENVLRLDTRGRSGQIAQRLGLYMALQWRTKFLHNNGGQAHRIATLLAAAGIDPKSVIHHEERKRVRDYLTSEGGALDQLQDVGAIGTRDDTGMLVDDWRYKSEEASDPNADASWDAWLQWTILIPAPRDVMDFYTIPRIARQAALKESAARKRRKERATDAARSQQTAKDE